MTSNLPNPKREFALRFVYIGDPMCSWCWGFAPVLDELQRTFNIPIDVMVGGLRPGPVAEPLDKHMRDFLAHHWEQVAATSGQAFDHAGLQRPDGWRYDTELPCVAVVTMRELAQAETLRFFARLKRAFYAENIDITTVDAYPQLLAGFDVSEDVFVDLLQSDAMKKAAWQDFATARKLGVSGFPTLLIQDGERWTLASAGYTGAEILIPSLRRWVEDHKPISAGKLICTVDGECAEPVVH